MRKNITTSNAGQIKGFVQKVFPKNNKEEIEKIARKLIGLGVVKLNDLLHLSENNLTEGGTIKLVQAKKLKNYALQCEYSLGIFTYHAVLIMRLIYLNL